MNASEKAIIELALSILENHLKAPGESINCPETVKRFLTLHLANLENEVFAVLFLDTRHRLISFEKMFTGTIDAATVYPREVAKKGLELNSRSVIFAHNHPSGTCEPSEADKVITQKLVAALDLIDIRVLDHVIVGRLNAFSFAEKGLL